MAYTALKPCCFAGTRYRVGEAVPDEVIHPGSARNLVKMGVIAETAADVDFSEPHQGTITADITVQAEGGTLLLSPEVSALQSVFDVLCGKVTEAEDIIKGMTDAAALVLLSVADNRKTVKEAAEARVIELEEDPESEGEE